MRRVVTPGGTVAVCVPASLEDQPAYRPLVEMVARHAGPEAISLLSTYWSCGDVDVLTAVIESAGLAVAAVRTTTGVARFTSPAEMVATEVESTPLIERISDEVYGAHPVRSGRGPRAVRDRVGGRRRTAGRPPRRRSTRVTI